MIKFEITNTLTGWSKVNDVLNLLRQRGKILLYSLPVGDKRGYVIYIKFIRTGNIYRPEVLKF